MKLRNARLYPVELKSKENHLLDQWAKQVPGFIRDGLPNAEQYVLSIIRILFILKEVNGGQDWDLREFLRKGARSQTWNVVARWAEGGVFMKNSKFDGGAANESARNFEKAVYSSFR